MGVTVHLFHLDINRNLCTPRGGVLRYFHAYVILGLHFFKCFLGCLILPIVFVGVGEGVNRRC